MGLYELPTIFNWGVCANCGKQVNEQNAICVLIYPEEFCSKECVEQWPITRQKKIDAGVYNGPHNSSW